MNNIYLVENDGFNFKWLALEIDDFIEKMPEQYSFKEVFRYSYNNLSLAEALKGTSSEFIQTETKREYPIPDISLWLTGASLALSQRAKSLLENMLAPFGELIPIVCGTETFYIFNCLTLAEADPEQSEHILQDGHIVGESKIGFTQQEVHGKLIFKTKFNSCRDIYCGDEIRNLAEANGLTGIKFSSTLIVSFD